MSDKSNIVKLTNEEQAMRAGEFGPLRQWAIEHQIKVGQYLGAEDFVPVVQAHIMADTESLGGAGVEWLEHWATLPQHQRLVRIPTITDPRGTDFSQAHRLKHQPWMLDLERRAIAGFEALGVLMTDTCINYQTIMPPVRGEHCAYGDTGVVIYSNSVCGARSNFEGGPSALSAGLTGRTPRYGFHLDAQRAATFLVEVSFTPRELSDWGALGGIVGRLAGDYSQVPALVGIDRVPGSDEMKHFGAALASFGSVALFHMAGITPEAMRIDDVVPEAQSLRTHDVGEADIRALQAHYAKDIGAVDLVVFSAPQLSLLEMQSLAGMLDGRRASDSAARGHQPAGQARRRPHGLHRAHRGRRRHRFVGHVLLSELCAGNGRSERLAAPGNQLGEVDQHHRRLRLQAGAAVDGRMRRGRVRRRKDRQMSAKIFYAAAGMGCKVQAQALVASDGFSARYDLDRVRGIFSRPEHKLAGESYRGRVLVLDAAKGGVATAWMLYEMKSRGVVPAALVLNRVNPIMVQGAALADFTMISGFDLDITKAIANGAMVEVDPMAERPLIRVF